MPGRPTARAVVLAATAAWIGSCGPSDTPTARPTESTPPPTATPRAPESLERDATGDLRAMEAALEQGARAEFAVNATGVITAKLRGTLALSETGIELAARGSIADVPVDMRFVDDGKRMTLTAGERQFDLPHEPTALTAMAVGIVRMGLLHNLAVLHGGRPPDHASGGSQTWVMTQDARFGREIDRLEPTSPDLFETPISFEIAVAGEPAGGATLWYDPLRSLPIERHQVVTFPEGEMIVRETYVWTGE